ncbi:MAG: hypothetical protein CL610_27325 [Anaerolineaceae bacterium]|nr:hypothetical protein [Anaerolineaceae bacterium]
MSAPIAKSTSATKAALERFRSNWPDPPSTRCAIEPGSPTSLVFLCPQAASCEHGIIKAVPILISSIGGSSMTDSRPELEQLIDGLGDPANRESVPSKLYEYGEAAVDPLIAALQADDEQLRKGAAWAIGRVINSDLGVALLPVAQEPLIECLTGDESGRVRLQALNTLIALSNSENRAALLEPMMAALSDSQEPVRMEAIRWLGQFGDADALKPLLAVLQEDASDKVKGRAAYALASIEPDLKTLSSAGDAGVRALITATKDEERGIRLRAIWALGILKPAEASRVLMDILEQNGNVPEKRKAAESLGQIGDRSALDALMIALQFDAHEGVRSSAADALGMIGDERALNMLIRALHSDATPSVRASAARALEALGDAGAVEPLILALEDEHHDVRFRAVNALGKLGDARAVEPLQTLLQDSQFNKQIRVAVEQALGAINA